VGLSGSPDSIAQSLLGWVLGCLVVYAALFGAGSYLYGYTTQGIVWTAVFVVCGAGLIRLIARLWRDDQSASLG
jgi:hypothetical protein